MISVTAGLGVVMRGSIARRKMELDAKHFTGNTMLDTDIRIVGAGPAGMVLVSELASLHCDVILLESGELRRAGDTRPQCW